jgi:16S rRNA (guanine966-N2)-methyltransferase
MRIIAGEFRSRRLLPPPETAETRPIPDRVKESLFAILRGNLEEANVLDLFAGTGAVGLEALSRGAAKCVFVERDRHMAAVLQKNIDTLGVRDRCEVVIGDALGSGSLARAPRPLNLVFFDPPYALMRDALGSKRVKAQLSAAVSRLEPHGFAVLRTPWPLLQDAPQVAPEVAPARRRKEGRRPKRARWEEVWTPDSPRSLDDFAAEPRAEEAPEEAITPAVVPETPQVAIDLAVPGAIGPETHEYGTMALHLYMRERSV